MAQVVTKDLPKVFVRLVVVLGAEVFAEAALKNSSILHVGSERPEDLQGESLYISLARTLHALYSPKAGGGGAYDARTLHSHGSRR